MLTLVFALVTFVLIMINTPLGGDESVYARGGRYLLGGPESYPLYRSIGMVLVAAPGVLLGGSEIALRILPWLLSVATFFSIVQFGSQLFSARVGRVVGVSFLCFAAFLARSAELLTDVSALLLYIAGLFILQTQCERKDGPSWRMVYVAPLFAGMFYLRYGTILLLSITLAVYAVFYGRRLVSHTTRPVVATLLLGILLFSFHLIYSWHETGDPLGILDLSRRAAPQAKMLQGFKDYARYLPMIGPILAGLVAFAVLYGPIAMYRRQLGKSAQVFLVIGLLFFLVQGALFQGRPRFIFAALWLLSLVGAHMADTWIGHLRKWVAYSAVAIVTIITVVLLFSGETKVRGSLLPVKRAMMTPQSPCLIYSNFPQASWYSKCEQRKQRQYRENSAILVDTYWLMVSKGRHKATKEYRSKVRERATLIFKSQSTYFLGSIELWAAQPD